jgi:arylsulfatase
MRLLSFAALLVGYLLISPAAIAQEQPANVFNNTVQTAPYLEPFIPRPGQDAVAAKKLAALEAKFGRKPNVLILLVDDMGWGDPGVYSGGQRAPPRAQKDRGTLAAAARGRHA